MTSKENNKQPSSQDEKGKKYESLFWRYHHPLYSVSPSPSLSLSFFLTKQRINYRIVTFKYMKKWIALWNGVCWILSFHPFCFSLSLHSFYHSFSFRVRLFGKSLHHVQHPTIQSQMWDMATPVLWCLLSASIKYRKIKINCETSISIMSHWRQNVYVWNDFGRNFIQVQLFKLKFSTFGSIFGISFHSFFTSNSIASRWVRSSYARNLHSGKADAEKLVCPPKRTIHFSADIRGKL